MKSADHTVRHVAPADKSAWLRLWQGYVTFYGAQVSQDVTDATWQRCLSPDHKNMFCLVAEAGGDVVGFVICVTHPGTWTTSDICYLEDLFVDETARGQGIGQSLIEGVYDKAKSENWHRVYWRTKSDNATARALYEKLADDNNWVMYEYIVS